MFVKRANKATLAEKIVETLVVEKDMLSNFVRHTQKELKTSKKKHKTTKNKLVDKEVGHLDSVVKMMNKLTNVVDLKKIFGENYSSNKSFYPSFKHNNNLMAKSTQTSNVNLNVEEFGIDYFCWRV